MAGAQLTEVQVTLRSLLVSSPTHMNLRALLNDYRKETGETVPYHKFGYDSIFTFLKERCSGYLVLSGDPRNPIVTPVIEEKLRHLNDLISKQRIPSTAKFRGKRSSVFVEKKIEKPSNTVYQPQQQKQSVSLGAIRKNSENKHSEKEPEKRPVKVDTAQEQPSSFQQSQKLGKPSLSQATCKKMAASKDMKTHLNQLMEERPEGMWLDDLSEQYSERFDCELDYGSVGYSSVASMCRGMSDTVRLESSATPGRMVVLSARADNTSHLLRPSRPLSRSYSYQQEISGDSDDALPGVPYDEGIFPEDCMGHRESIAVLSLKSLKAGQLVEVNVSEVLDPSHFWFQLRGEEHDLALELLMDEMQAYYTTGEGRDRVMEFGAVQVAQYCATNYGTEGWHRSIIVQIVNSKFVKVRHVDYGSLDTVERSELRVLRREWAALPAQALRGCLAHLRPAGRVSCWMHEAAMRFHALIDSKPLFAKIHSISGETSVVRMFLIDTTSAEDVHIHDLLVKEKHASYTHMDQEVSLPSVVPLTPAHDTAAYEVWVRTSSSSDISESASVVVDRSPKRLKEWTPSSADANTESDHSVLANREAVLSRAIIESKHNKAKIPITESTLKTFANTDRQSLTKVNILRSKVLPNRVPDSPKFRIELVRRLLATQAARQQTESGSLISGPVEDTKNPILEDYLLPSFEDFENGRAMNLTEKCKLVAAGIFPEGLETPLRVPVVVKSHQEEARSAAASLLQHTDTALEAMPPHSQTEVTRGPSVPYEEDLPTYTYNTIPLNNCQPSHKTFPTHSSYSVSECSTHVDEDSVSTSSLSATAKPWLPGYRQISHTSDDSSVSDGSKETLRSKSGCSSRAAYVSMCALNDLVDPALQNRPHFQSVIDRKIALVKPLAREQPSSQQNSEYRETSTTEHIQLPEPVQSQANIEPMDNLDSSQPHRFPHEAPTFHRFPREALTLHRQDNFEYYEQHGVPTARPQPLFSQYPHYQRSKEYAPGYYPQFMENTPEYYQHSVDYPSVYSRSPWGYPEYIQYPNVYPPGYFPEHNENAHGCYPRQAVSDYFQDNFEQLEPHNEAANGHIQLSKGLELNDIEVEILNTLNSEIRNKYIEQRMRTLNMSPQGRSERFGN